MTNQELENALNDIRTALVIILVAMGFTLFGVWF